ncbi:hypothetical protein H5410_054967 [Solanum commersonii]|uniref:pyruvate kinase n=1 Tax=Solanum commersonii TaxID=4109 RepID=A0A9J5WGB8_SOLCO|nr:hypothetical protein H5410_054967 [Solanum commersonii]
MHSTNLLLEEPIRMASILEPSKPTFFPAMTKIVGTLGPKSRSVEIISSCLESGMSGKPGVLTSHYVQVWEGADKIGSYLAFCKRLFPLHEPVTSWSHCSSFYHCTKALMAGTKLIKNIDTTEPILLLLCISVARFDFSWGDAEFHQETLENLRAAVKKSKKLCAVMLDTGGPELQVVNKSEHPISLQADALVVLTPDQDKEATPNLLPINFSGLSKASYSITCIKVHFEVELTLIRRTVTVGGDFRLVAVLSIGVGKQETYGLKEDKVSAELGNQLMTSSVKKGDTIFIGQYLFTGSETTSVWLEKCEKALYPITVQSPLPLPTTHNDTKIITLRVTWAFRLDFLLMQEINVTEVKGEDVVCLIKNSATLAGPLYTLHVSQIRIELPTLTDKDKKVISSWAVRNKIDILSLSYTRNAEDVRHAREFLSKLGDLNQTQIFAKIENVEGMGNFDEILGEADGIILSRGNLGIDLPPEKTLPLPCEGSEVLSERPLAQVRLERKKKQRRYEERKEEIKEKPHSVRQAGQSSHTLALPCEGSEVLFERSLAQNSRGGHPCSLILVIVDAFHEREVQLIVASVNESDKGSQNIFLNSCFLSHYYMKEQLLHVFLFQKAAVHRCNMAGKPAVVTRVVDSMTDNLRPTRAEATDVANAVLDGSDAILLGAETLRGLYPVETISTVGKICAEGMNNLLKVVNLVNGVLVKPVHFSSQAEKVYNQDVYFKRAVKCVGEPMTHLESIASSAVRAAIKVKASVIICFTSSGRAARLIAKYRPPMPVLSVVIPRLKTNQLRWTFSGAFQARQSLIVRGIFPILADPRHPSRKETGIAGSVTGYKSEATRTADSTNATDESILKVALDHGKTAGVIKPHDRVVVFQKVGDASVVKIIELEN